MVEVAKTLIEFTIVFLLVYLCYTLFFNKKNKTYNRAKSPINVKYLVYKYNFDVVRYGYKRVCKTLTLCDSLIIATVYAATKFIDNIYIRLLVIFILIFPVFAGVYHLVVKYYNKKDGN